MNGADDVFATETVPAVACNADLVFEGRITGHVHPDDRVELLKSEISRWQVRDDKGRNRVV
jgi:hypothetical protein